MPNTFLLVREAPTGPMPDVAEPSSPEERCGPVVATVECIDDIHAERCARALAWSGDYHVERREPPQPQILIVPSTLGAIQ